MDKLFHLKMMLQIVNLIKFDKLNIDLSNINTTIKIIKIQETSTIKLISCLILKLIIQFL